jgi:hypothetical protein
VTPDQLAQQAQPERKDQLAQLVPKVFKAQTAQQAQQAQLVMLAQLVLKVFKGTPDQQAQLVEPDPQVQLQQ